MANPRQHSLDSIIRLADVACGSASALATRAAHTADQLGGAAPRAINMEKTGTDAEPAGIVNALAARIVRLQRALEDAAQEMGRIEMLTNNNPPVTAQQTFIAGGASVGFVRGGYGGQAGG